MFNQLRCKKIELRGWLVRGFPIFRPLRVTRILTPESTIAIEQLHVVEIYHFLKAQNFPEFLDYVIEKPLIDFISKYIFKHQFPKSGK